MATTTVTIRLFNELSTRQTQDTRLVPLALATQAAIPAGGLMAATG
jgi:hypothetical protein